MDREFYSVAEAATTAGVSQDELRCAIRDGLLPAQMNQATGGLSIKREHLQSYMKAMNHEAPDDGHRRVLIIDDEINFGNLIKLDLQRDKRIQAKFATWGLDGITLAQAFRPHVILLDFMLPDATAEQVLEGIRELQQKIGTKVIVYSAHTAAAVKANPDLEARLKSMGADCFMDKTAGLKALVTQVYQLCGFDSSTRVLKARPLF